MTRELEFTNEAGNTYKIKPINKWLLLLKAEKITNAEMSKPKQPTYLHTYKDPTGGESHELELITQTMVDSPQASESDKALWASYLAKLKAYNSLLTSNTNTLTMTQAFVDPVSSAFIDELKDMGIYETMSADEVKLMWIVSEVAPTENEQNKLKEIFQELNGVRSDDVNKVADTFRSK